MTGKVWTAYSFGSLVRVCIIYVGVYVFTMVLHTFGCEVLPASRRGVLLSGRFNYIEFLCGLTLRAGSTTCTNGGVSLSCGRLSTRLASLGGRYR